MASIELRESPNGTSYRVVWRQGDKKRSKTWTSRDRAELWKGLIEQLDGGAARAKQHLARTVLQSPTVAEVADHRPGLLRATKYTRQTYQRYMRLHIGPALGDWPVDTVSEDDCRRLVLALEAKELSPRQTASWRRRLRPMRCATLTHP